MDVGKFLLFYLMEPPFSQKQHQHHNNPQNFNIIDCSHCG
jgi:hypothetical protein